VLVFALAAFVACGRRWLYKTQATLEWDAVTLDVEGHPFLPGT